MLEILKIIYKLLVMREEIFFAILIFFYQSCIPWSIPNCWYMTCRIFEFLSKKNPSCNISLVLTCCRDPFIENFFSSPQKLNPIYMVKEDKNHTGDMTELLWHLCIPLRHELGQTYFPSWGLTKIGNFL